MIEIQNLALVLNFDSSKAMGMWTNVAPHFGNPYISGDWRNNQTSMDPYVKTKNTCSLPPLVLSRQP